MILTNHCLKESLYICPPSPHPPQPAFWKAAFPIALSQERRQGRGWGQGMRWRRTGGERGGGSGGDVHACHLPMPREQYAPAATEGGWEGGQAAEGRNGGDAVPPAARVLRAALPPGARAAVPAVAAGAVAGAGAAIVAVAAVRRKEK